MDCEICGEKSNEYKCGFDHVYHLACIRKEKNGRQCLICSQYLQKIKDLSDSANPISEIQRIRCIGKVLSGRRCRLFIKAGTLCHIHKDKVATIVAAVSEPGLSPAQE
jgi:hypothetical protein